MSLGCSVQVVMVICQLRKFEYTQVKLHCRSKYLFVENRKTLLHPLIIGAGFDGTGLSALKRALAILGKTRTAFPAFAQRDCDRHDKTLTAHPCADSAMIEAVMQHGFQNDS